MADAIGKLFISSNGLSEVVDVGSRGLTDDYSAWGSGAEQRMISAATEIRQLDPAILEHLKDHHSSLLTREEVVNSRTLFFLVTKLHLSWMRNAVGDEAVDKAQTEKRIFMVDSSGTDVPDPYFGDKELYREVCGQIIRETDKTLKAALMQHGLAI
jgi:protein-tyrosine-phosphatase